MMREKNEERWKKLGGGGALLDTIYMYDLMVLFL